MKRIIGTFIILAAVAATVPAPPASARMGIWAGAWCEFIGNHWDGEDGCWGPQLGGWYEFGRSISGPN